AGGGDGGGGARRRGAAGRRGVGGGVLRPRRGGGAPTGGRSARPLPGRSAAARPPGPAARASSRPPGRGAAPLGREAVRDRADPRCRRPVALDADRRPWGGGAAEGGGKGAAWSSRCAVGARACGRACPTR